MESTPELIDLPDHFAAATGTVNGHMCL
jgi:hypothetical protein